MTQKEEPEISDEAKERAKNYMALKGALEVKEETLEEAAERIISDMGWIWENTESSARMVAEFCAKQQAERMYSEEDIREAFRQGEDNVVYSKKYGLDYRLSESKWLEQFKKSNP
jgi:hypothetical protein